MGPFTIAKRINAFAYQLREIPGGARLSRKHGRAPVYHVSQLKVYTQPDYPSHQEDWEAPDLGTDLIIDSLVMGTALTWDNPPLTWDNLPQHPSETRTSHWRDNALRQGNTLRWDNALSWDNVPNNTITVTLLI
jgi:hypothetical protein